LMKVGPHQRKLVGVFLFLGPNAAARQSFIPN
jgi:hypothetical protein